MICSVSSETQYVPIDLPAGRCPREVKHGCWTICEDYPRLVCFRNVIDLRRVIDGNVCHDFRELMLEPQ